jgi:hypothetical protein
MIQEGYTSKQLETGNNGEDKKSTRKEDGE